MSGPDETTPAPTPAPTPQPTLPPGPVVPFYCGPGKYPDIYTGTCRSCPDRSYSLGGAAKCTACPPMYRRTEYGSGCEPYGPLKCKAGYFGGKIPGTWKYPCKKCPTGTYRSADDTNTMECDTCSAGSVPNEDQSGCVALLTPAPTLQPTFYPPIHYDCAPGYYDSLIESVGCLKCPPGTISQSFTTKCEECPGRLTNAARTECVRQTPAPTVQPTPAPTLLPKLCVPSVPKAKDLQKTRVSANSGIADMQSGALRQKEGRQL